MTIRTACAQDLERINAIRRQVNDLHVQGRPDIFKAGFDAALQEHIQHWLEGENTYIAVAELDGVIVGFACVKYVDRPETPYMNARAFADIDEFGVDRQYRRQGIGRALINYVKAAAREKGVKRIELNMWAFNEGALAFYEELGFKTYRRYMEMSV